MQTTFYTFTANEIIVTGAGVEQVSGDNSRRMVYLRHAESISPAPEGRKLIDFNAWCADREAKLCAEETHCVDEVCCEEEEPVRRERTCYGARIGMYLDWIASAALTAVALAACFGFLF